MTNNSKRSPMEVVRLKKRFESLYVVDLLSQKAAADLCEISGVTACHWVKELGLKEKREAAKNKASRGRDNDSANYMVIKLKKERPDIYPIVMEGFNHVFNTK